MKLPNKCIDLNDSRNDMPALCNESVSIAYFHGLNILTNLYAKIL